MSATSSDSAIVALQLQRLAGNTATTRLLGNVSDKLRDSPPNVLDAATDRDSLRHGALAPALETHPTDFGSRPSSIQRVAITATAKSATLKEAKKGQTTLTIERPATDFTNTTLNAPLTVDAILKLIGLKNRNNINITSATQAIADTGTHTLTLSNVANANAPSFVLTVTLKKEPAAAVAVPVSPAWDNVDRSNKKWNQTLTAKQIDTFMETMDHQLTWANIARGSKADEIVKAKKGTVLNDSHVRIDQESDYLDNYWRYRIQGKNDKYPVVGGFYIQKNKVFTDAHIKTLVRGALEQGPNKRYRRLWDATPIPPSTDATPAPQLNDG